MNDLTHWQEHNNAYLAAELQWLRQRLARLAGAEESPGPLTSASMLTTQQSEEYRVGRRLLGRWRKKPAGTPVSEAVQLPPEAPAMADKHVAPAATDTVTTAGSDSLPALMFLARCFGLSRFEQALLLLCVAMELDTRIAALCAHAQADSACRYPTFALALALFDDPLWEALSPERPLRYWRFLEINQPGAQPLTTSALRADERILNYIKGLNYLDDRRTLFLRPLPV